MLRGRGSARGKVLTLEKALTATYVAATAGVAATPCRLGHELETTYQLLSGTGVERTTLDESDEADDDDE